MRRVAHLVVALGLSGCEVLFPISDPPARTPTTPATVEHHRLRILDVNEDRIVPTTGAVLVPDADGALQAVPLVDGTAAIPVPLADPAGYVFAYTTDDGVQRFVQLGTPDIVIEDLVYGHADAQPAPASAAFVVTGVGLAPTVPYVPGQPERLQGIGTWFQESLTGTQLPPMGATMASGVPIAYRDARPQPSGAEPLQLAAADPIFLLRYDAVDPTHLLGVARLHPLPLGEGVNPIPGDTELATTPTTTMLTLDTATLAARLAPTGTSPTFAWTVTSTPAPGGGGVFGIPLGEAVIAAATPATPVPVTYQSFAALPYPAILHVAGVAYAGSSTHTWLTLFTVFEQSLVAPPALTAAMPQGLPMVTTLNGIALNVSDQRIDVDASGTLELVASFDRESCRRIRFDIDALDDDQRSRTPRVHVVTTAPMITIPATALARDVAYVMRTTCEVDNPALVDGHDTETGPFELAYRDSQPFRLQ